MNYNPEGQKSDELVVRSSAFFRPGCGELFDAFQYLRVGTLDHMGGVVSTRISGRLHKEQVMYVARLGGEVGGVGEASGYVVWHSVDFVGGGHGRLV